MLFIFALKLTLSELISPVHVVRAHCSSNDHIRLLGPSFGLMPSEKSLVVHRQQPPFLRPFKRAEMGAMGWVKLTDTNIHKKLNLHI
jgi:hypothetical protein